MKAKSSIPTAGVLESRTTQLLGVHLALIGVQLAFGSFHVVGKSLLGELHPFVLASLRVAGATPLLLILAWRLERTRPALRDLPVLFLLGMLGVASNQLLFIIGLKHTTAINAAIIMPSIPIFTAAAAAVLRVEKLTARKAVGIALAVVGALVMLDVTHFSLGRDRVLGNALLLCNSLCYAFYLVLQRPVLKRLPPLTVTAWSFIFGGAVVWLFGIGPVIRTDAASVPTWVWLGMAYVIFVPTIGAYAANTWALGKSSSTLTATYITLQPLVTAVLAAIFLHEKIGPREVMGFGLIVAGLVFVSLRANGAGGMNPHPIGDDGGTALQAK